MKGRGNPGEKIYRISKSFMRRKVMLFFETGFLGEILAVLELTL